MSQHFCLSCGTSLLPGKRVDAKFCSPACRQFGYNHANEDGWRYCLDCGHTDDMHDDALRDPICMEPKGEGFCKCRLRTSNHAKPLTA